MLVATVTKMLNFNRKLSLYMRSPDSCAK